ncbi:MAG: hypothetical protein HN348_31695 [Proteobacteria bacterium]|nr:hypothetical protein [Pseudomonadota bacterium]
MGRMTKDEVCCLGRVPFAIFLLVSAADGKFQKKELVAFLECIKSSGDETIREAMVIAKVRADEVIAELAEDVDGALPMVEEASTIIDERLTLKEGVRVKRTLFNAARATARASGGGWFGLGAKIGHEERKALKQISDALGL